MRQHVIVLDVLYAPIGSIDVVKTVNLLIKGKAIPVVGVGEDSIRTLGLVKNCEYNFPVEMAHLVVDDKLTIPSIIRLLKPVDQRFIKRPHPTRNGIFKRDKDECQYCGSKDKLTLDHILPHSRGGENTWENLVTSCVKCNNKKGDQTPEEWGRKLKTIPKAPPGTITPDFWSRLMKW